MILFLFSVLLTFLFLGFSEDVDTPWNDLTSSFAFLKPFVLFICPWLLLLDWPLTSLSCLAFFTFIDFFDSITWYRNMCHMMMQMLHDPGGWSDHLSRLCLPHSPIHTDLPTPNLKINFHSQKLMLWCFEGRVTSWLAILRASSTDSIVAKLT